MKRSLLTMLLASTVLCSYQNNLNAENNVKNEKVQLKECKPSIAKEEYLYQIKDKEILINDKLITLISFGKNISAAYRNKNDKEMKPKYEIKIYNAYGMLLGKANLGSSTISFGNSTYMEPGEVSSERIYLKEYPINEILKHSSVKIPKDILGRKWVIISNTNTK